MRAFLVLWALLLAGLAVGLVVAVIRSASRSQDQVSVRTHEAYAAGHLADSGGRPLER
ncbi:MAG TPA: hypothetical protein P5181_07980 [Dermatophilaceae bacterium]|nr:hypothetical protein [Dermatophilaceae bacterium]